jgi:hypothetical protein
MQRKLRSLPLFFVAIFAIGGIGRPGLTRAQTQPDWLVALNGVRTAAGLPAVTEDVASSTGARKHSIYAILNNNLTHVEDPNAPGYTVDGAQAGQVGALGSQIGGSTPSGADAIRGILTTGYHWFGLMAPNLTSVAYGAASYQDAFPGQTPPGNVITSAYALIGNFSQGPPNPTQPIMWPPNGGTMPYRTYDGGENPDPLASCPGYAAPTGAPFYLQLPAIPQVTATTLTMAGVQGPLDSCWQTSSYAVIIFPKQPLVDGTYCVSVTDNGTPINWSFTVGNAPVAPPPPCGQNTGAPPAQANTSGQYQSG